MSVAAVSLQGAIEPAPIASSNAEPSYWERGSIRDPRDDVVLLGMVFVAPKT
jgi:hypothetical protein